MKRPLIRGHLIQVILLAICLAAGAILLVPLKNEADKRAGLLKNRLIGQLESSLGISMSYRSISPALLSVITVKGLHVEFPQGNFRAETLRVYYNPLRRVRGDENDPIRMISRVTVKEGHLNLSLETGGKEIMAGSPSAPSDFDPWQYLVDKSVSLEGISANISLNNDTLIDAKELSLLIRDNEGTVRYSMDSIFSATDSDRFKSIGKIVAEISSSGSFAPKTSAINGRVDLNGIETSLVYLEPVAIDFTFSGNELTARRIDDERPLDLSIYYSPERWSVDGVAEALSLRDMAVPGPSGLVWDSWYSSILDGRFAISGITGTDSVNYRFDLGLSVPPGPVPMAWQADINLHGNLENADIDSVRIHSRQGNVEYTGAFGIRDLSPDGLFSFNLEEEFLGYPIAAAFNLKTTDGTITAEPVVFEAAGLNFHDFRFLVVRETDVYAVSLLAVPVQPDEESPRSLTLDALIDLSSNPVVYGFAAMNGFNTSDILRLAGWDGIDGIDIISKSQFSLNSSFEANRDSWVLTVDDATLADNENPLNTISFRGKATPGNWSLNNLRISWNDYVVDGRGYGRSSDKGGTAQGRFIVKEEVFPFNADWSADGRLKLDSDFGLSATLGPRSVNGRAVQVVSDQMVIPLKDGSMIARLDVRGRIARSDWDIYLNTVDIALVDRAESENLSFQLRGTVNPGSIRLPEILLVDGLGNLKGNLTTETSNNGNDIRGRLMLAGSDTEVYDVSVFRNAGIWDVGLSITDARIERFMKSRVSGRLNLGGKMTGSVDNPTIELRVSTRDGILDGQPYKTEAKLTMNAGRIRLQDAVFEHEGISLSRGLLLFNMNEGSLRGTAELKANYNQVPVSTGFSLGMDFGRKMVLTDLPSIIKGQFTGTLATREVLWNNKPHMPPFTFQFAKDLRSFKVQSPDGKVLKVDYIFESGKLDVLSGSPMPVIVRGGGTVKDSVLDLSFPEFDMDPVLINYVMLRDPILLQYHVIFESGRLKGNLDLKGPVGDPDLYGTIRADNLKVDTPYTYAVIKPASTDIHLNGNRITVDPIQIPVGEGLVYAYGHIVLDRWSLTEFDMIYGGRAAPKGNGVPVYYPMMGVNLDGLFTGEVHMTGGNKRFFLTGDITFPYLKASMGSARIPVNQARPGAYPAAVFLNFNFITGNNCTFFLPNEQVKIVKAVAEPGRTVNLIYSSQPKSLSISGLLPIKSGDIFYFDRAFQITEGSMRFNETLGNFDPILAFQAETKVRDTQGKDVSVALVYSAPVMSDFNPTIITIPPRSDSEILALFGQAVTPYSKSGDTNAASTVLKATGGMFGQVGLVQPFEEVLREGLNLDMVTIQTDIIENTLAQGLNRDSETYADSQSFGLGQYLDNTSLFAGKYIGNALFVSGTVSANYFEGQRLRSVFGGLEFETSVSLEMETPFFNVAWSYRPDPTTTQNFVADNEISLKWQFTF